MLEGIDTANFLDSFAFDRMAVSFINALVLDLFLRCPEHLVEKENISKLVLVCQRRRPQQRKRIRNPL